MSSLLLRDIDLDLPYKENKAFIEELINNQALQENDAIRLDYEMNWKKKRINFRDEIRCIADLYLHHLGKYLTQETKKIMINCVERINSNKIQTCDGFTEIEVEFDFRTYTKCEKEEKKKFVLEKLYEGVLKVAETYEWEVPMLKQAYQNVIESNYKNEYVWKQKASPSRKYTAEIFCQHEIDKYTVTMNIKSRDTNESVKSEILFIERPNGFAFVKHLGDLKWISNTEVILLNKNKTKKWLVCIE
ncbi:hypothetical protein [Bacillus sp. ISL-7]|uniref:hypothetical protein n=1 Tax=Bacillus sp. ISL-7 TaxID=2819136 RepID=UPI001BE6E994|nr:hypothetical protein [Bacillus sp. ISL-7]MBT2739078.1 hypothetical protein [Bacillus sp. ISL-7]